MIFAYLSLSPSSKGIAEAASVLSPILLTNAARSVTFNCGAHHLETLTLPENAPLPRGRSSRKLKKEVCVGDEVGT